MKRKLGLRRNYLIALIAFVISVVVGILVFFSCIQQAAEENSQTTMMTNAFRQAEHLRTILDIHYQYLKGIAAEMGKEEELFCDENKERLVSFCKETDLERFGLFDPEGNVYYDNGVTKNVAHRRYFQEAISGMETLSDPLESSVDQEVRVVLGVPIYKDGEIVGALGGSCNVTALSHMLFDDLFGGAGNSLLVTSDGYMVAFDTGSAAKSAVDYGKNLFDYYKERKLENPEVLDKLKEDFAAGEGGQVTLDFSGAKESRYLAYRALGRNDWMICYSVPISAAQQAYSFIRKYEWIFMGVFCVMVAVLVLYLAYQNWREREEMLRAAEIDSLTGVYNKASVRNRLIRS